MSQADIVSLRVQEDGLKASREVFTSFRRVVKEAVATTALPSAVLDTKRIEAALDTMAKLIDSELDAKLRATKMHEAMRVIQSYLIDQEARAKTEDLA